MYALIRGKQLHYDITGINRKGEDPILLVHGWGGSAESLSPLAKILSTSNKVILVDLPGFGKSDLPDINWGVEEYTEVVADL